MPGCTVCSSTCSGAEALSEADQREQGLQRLVEALERYPQLFAEPLWRDGFVARLH